MTTPSNPKSLVGKTVSIVDVVKRINRVLRGDNPDEERIPDSPIAKGENLQTLHHTTGHRTEVSFTRVEYDMEIPEEIFSEQ